MMIMWINTDICNKKHDMMTMRIHTDARDSITK